MTPEQANRFRKASALADAIEPALLASATSVDDLTDEAWLDADRVVAAKAGRGVRPSSAETRALVRFVLADRARVRAGDPFDGLVEAS